MTNEQAVKAFENRNFWLDKNPVCQAIPERVVKQRSEIERNELAITALLEKQERDQPKLLSIEELQQMSGEPIWVEDFKMWAIVSCETEGYCANIPFANAVSKCGSRFGWDIVARSLRCYRYKPKEEA